MLMHTPTRPSAHARAHTHTHTHTEIYVEYLLLYHGNNDSRTCLIVTLYVHCLYCLVAKYSLNVLFRAGNSLV
jgi:hypothetical protein